MRIICSIAFTLASLTLASFAQPIGTTYVAGTTYANSQLGGAIGRMIALDSNSFVHVVWGFGTVEGTVQHILYNVFDPEQGFFAPNGTQVDATNGVWMPTLAVTPAGFCFPVYCVPIGNSGQFQVETAIDYLPGNGAFSNHVAPGLPLYNPQPEGIAWPMSSADRHGTIHQLVQEDQSYARIFYGRVIPTYTDFGEGESLTYEPIGPEGSAWLDIAITQSKASQIICSRISNRVVIAYTEATDLEYLDFPAGDIYLLLSEDGGHNWAEPLNVTQFIPPDRECYDNAGDELCCTGDTLRAYQDMSLLFDNNDDLQIAFSAIGVYQWVNDEEGPYLFTTRSAVWHWSEQNDSFQPIAENWNSTWTSPAYPACGRSVIEHVSLAIDTISGDIYCAYMQYNSSQYSSSFHLNADIFVSKLNRETGLWYQGINITNTAPSDVPCEQGECANEQELSAAELITTGNDSAFMHIFYLLDYDAGGCSQNSLWTLNDMIYHRLHVAELEWQDLMPDRQFHVQPSLPPCNLSGNEHHRLPGRITLEPAFPNPFNSSTTIRFSIPSRAAIEFSVFDITGRLVRSFGRTDYVAGEHELSLSFKSEAAGVYFVRLESGTVARTQKILYLR